MITWIVVDIVVAMFVFNFYNAKRIRRRKQHIAEPADGMLRITSINNPPYGGGISNYQIAGWCRRPECPSPRYR